jgi:hypothetical protein
MAASSPREGQAMIRPGMSRSAVNELLWKWPPNLLIGQPRDAHHHAVAVLPVREERERRRFAADLVAGVVEVGEVLDLGERQQAHVRRALGEAEDGLLVEQRVEHAPGRNVFRDRGHVIDAALRATSSPKTSAW